METVQQAQPPKVYPLENQLAQLQEVKKTQATENSLIVSAPISGLTPEENAVIARKYKSPPFREMELANLLIITQLLLLKISVITGWQNPEGPLLTILIDQFSQKLKESYPTVNPDEFAYAFRTY